jgi:MFS superfamily sulfate permease-like transporter
MDSLKTNKFFSNPGGDLAAGLVVFFVAMPLCLGIALASGAPLFSGIVAGIIGGLVIGGLSRSQLSVSGPAAGLAAIVLAAITDLGAFDIFLCAVIIAGIIQLALGFLKAGSIANYFPSNVIEGMLAGIGLIIILKQLPHAVGFDKDYEGNEGFAGFDGGNTFSFLTDALNFITPGAVVVAMVSLALMLLWEKSEFLKKIKILPGPLVAVVAGVFINELFIMTGSTFAIGSEHLVNLPVPASFGEFFAQFSLPNFSGFSDRRVWIHGLTIAVVASVETLLCLEAVDRLDPLKRYSPTNRELKAQGIGNIVSGLIGGLPITSVIVRSSANVNAGGKTKLSTIFHGALLLVCAGSIPLLLNKIPLAVLAAILLLTGYKLAKPALFKKWWRAGFYQFVPFIVTVTAIVFTDLLLGVALGMIVSIFFILRENLKSPYFFNHNEYHTGEIIHLNLAQEVSFLNKAAIKLTLENLPEKSYVIIDARETSYIDHDVLELIREFQEIKSVERDIRLELVGFKPEYRIDNTLKHQFVYTESEAAPASMINGAPRRKHEELIGKLVGAASKPSEA